MFLGSKRKDSTCASGKTLNCRELHHIAHMSVHTHTCTHGTVRLLCSCSVGPRP